MAVSKCALSPARVAAGQRARRQPGAVPADRPHQWARGAPAAAAGPARRRRGNHAHRAAQTSLL